MSVKYDIEKFNGRNDFSLWRVKMRAVLVQQGLLKALQGVEALPQDWSAEEKEDALNRAHSAIMLSLSDEVLREVDNETTAAGLWLNLESRYMTKSLTNRLYLKQRLYTLRMTEGSNNLSGIVPPSIYNLSSIVTFDIQQNQIRGSIPSDLPKKFPNLEGFLISWNQFTGSIPVSISNLTNLVNFEVQDNKLTGKVPNLQKLVNLETFNIYNNQLGTGTDGDLSFVSDLTNATELKWLIVYFNNFGGTLPTSISNLSTKLEIFGVQGNKLYGNIPAGMGNLVNLQLLSFGKNNFSGYIPSDIGKLTRLNQLDFESNRLSGSVPTSLQNLTMLSLLELQGNNLQGNIPSIFGKFNSILHLDLSQNNFNGTIPQEVIGLNSLSITLNLSGNQ
ncbi:receptor kinase-like protein Xa21 [Pyrus x bretschneideri]|uniref:receptor kinase-like protein Xa21 n=1 Tax=Pyrus x bretschneideri TaxID=225117 RepID=UPI00202DD000|nr:receptor kinase-like protein Xa21 [Pyrus x bretschneideri]